MNLAEIIGREDDYDASRIAELEVIDNTLWITEACDNYFSIELNHTETQRLIDWLTDASKQLGGTK